MSEPKLAQHARDVAQAFGVLLEEHESMAPEGAFATLVPMPGMPPEFMKFLGMPSDGFKVVAVHPIIDETTYAVALHEMGHMLAAMGSMPHEKIRRQHCADPNCPKLHPQTVEWWRLTLTEEAAAWEWAQHYALYWTAAMQGVHDWAMGTYRSGEKNAVEATREVAAKQAEQERVRRRTHIDSASAFAKKIGRNIVLD